MEHEGNVGGFREGRREREYSWLQDRQALELIRASSQIYRDLHTTSDRNPPLYQKIPLPSLTPKEIMFCPFEDVLGVGHDSGFSSLLVPGSGIAQFDSNEADVFESHSRHREREVRGVLEKISADLITMDTDYLGKLADPKKVPFTEKETPFYKKNRLERLQELGKAPLEEEEPEATELGQSTTPGAALEREKLKRKMRGKNKSLSRYLRKKKKNVIDPQLVSLSCLPTGSRADEAVAGRREGEDDPRARKGRDGAQGGIRRDQGGDWSVVEVQIAPYTIMSPSRPFPASVGGRIQILG